MSNVTFSIMNERGAFVIFDAQNTLPRTFVEIMQRKKDMDKDIDDCSCNKKYLMNKSDIFIGALINTIRLYLA